MTKCASQELIPLQVRVGDEEPPGFKADRVVLVPT